MGSVDPDIKYCIVLGDFSSPSDTYESTLLKAKKRYI